jgi:hypothetical protein
MRYKYEIECEIDMSFVPEIDKLANELTRYMNDFGFPEKIMLLSNCSPMALTVDRELTDQEKLIAMSTIQERLDSVVALKKWQVKGMKLVK